jgi:hypothetical protein
LRVGCAAPPALYNQAAAVVAVDAAAANWEACRPAPALLRRFGRAQPAWPALPRVMPPPLARTAAAEPLAAAAPPRGLLLNLW